MRPDAGLALAYHSAVVGAALLAAPLGLDAVAALAVLLVLAARAGGSALLPRAARERLDWLVVAASVLFVLVVADRLRRAISP